MGGTASNTAGVKDVFDPCFIQTPERGAENQIVASTVLTSREIVLTQETAAPVGKAVPVSSTESLTVYGDVVKVCGTIKTPGRTMKIFCRRLEFFPGADNTSGIVVTGERGTDGVAENHPAAAGKDGIHRSNPNGTDGEDGKDGGTGFEGGGIEIYCDTFAPLTKVMLIADGGRGGDGARGQQGGAGGNGSNGFVTEADRSAAFGGYGGRGGNGGNGGQGGKGGRITLHFMKYDPVEGKDLVTISALGGGGGNGATGGMGGNGGNGGTPAAETSAFGGTGPIHFSTGIGRQYEHVYLGGANSGGGGICGLPGYFGNSGAWGSVNLGVPLGIKPGTETNTYINFHWDWLYEKKSPEESALLDALVGTLKVRFPDKPTRGIDGLPLPNPDERGKPGTPGKGSEMFRGDKARYDPAHPERTGIFPGKDGEVFQSPHGHKAKGARIPLIPAPGKKVEHKKIDYKELASRADMEQLKMLFEHVRTTYLLTSVQKADSGSIQKIMETLTWLMMLSETAEPALFGSASSTLNNLRQGWNAFGKDTEFAVMGSLEEYKTDLKTMLELFKPIEDTYLKLNQFLNAAKEQKTYLGNVLEQQRSLAGRLQELEKETANLLKTTAAAIQTLDEARKELAGTLSTSLNSLQGNIQSAIGLSAPDFCNLFTQLSFTSVEPSQHKGLAGFLDGLGARTGAMVFSQTGEMINKALENVPTDTGASINKNYIIRRMQFLDKDVKTVADFQVARDGLIKLDPSKEYRLQMTREQLEAICANFYEKFPVAREVTAIFDEYLETVAARNEKIAEYNQWLTDLCYVQGEAKKTKAQQTQAETALKMSTNPGLPAMAGFSSALRRHALERCIEQLYMASRVYTLQALDPYDVFADLLGRVASTNAPGELDSNALNDALIDIISRNLEAKQKKKGTRVDFKPQGDHCSVTLTPKKNPLLFKMLKEGKAGTFQILPAGRDATVERNPFAGMAEVRITGIRCTAKGMKTGDDVHTIEITHPGIETFYTEDGDSIRIHHNPVLVPCRYDTKAASPPGFVELEKDRRMIGPFCQWIIAIPKSSNGSSLDLTGLEYITVEFEGQNRGFVAREESVSVSGAPAGG